MKWSSHNVNTIRNKKVIPVWTSRRCEYFSSKHPLTPAFVSSANLLLFFFFRHFFYALSIILITSPIPIGRTSPLHLFSGIRRLARISSIVVRSMYNVHNRRVRVARASHKLEPDFLNDLLARIPWKPLASTLETSVQRLSKFFWLLL